jgi:hypothetical protein
MLKTMVFFDTIKVQVISKENAFMKINLKNLVASLTLSASVLAVSQVYAAVDVAPTSVEAIASAKQALATATSSLDALTAKVKTLLATTSPETIAAALVELKISPAVALQAMVNAGVPVVDAVGALVAANPDTKNAQAVVDAAIAITPEAKVAIAQAAIDAGASIDAIPAGVVGSVVGATFVPQSTSTTTSTSAGGGGGVVVPPPVVSAN